MFPTVFKYYSKGNYGKRLEVNEFLFIIQTDDRKEADRLFILSTGYDLLDVYVKEQPAFTKVDFKNLLANKRGNTPCPQEDPRDYE